MHDAVIRAMNFHFSEQKLEVVFDYNDGVEGEENGKYARTRFTLSWVGIRESRLRFSDGDLYGMDFAKDGTLIRTTFEDYTWGLDGYICSQSVEISAIMPSPESPSCGEPGFGEILLAMQ